MKLKYSIYLKSHTGRKVKLPVLPSELPEIAVSADVEDFTAIKGGHYTLIGLKQQPTVSAEHLVLKKGKKLRFRASDTTGNEVIKILKEATKNRTPVKYIIAKSSGGYYLNDWFAVTSYSYHIDKKQDYIIAFELTGWKSYAGWKKASGEKISLSPSKITLKKGKSETSTLKNINADGKVSWKTSDKSVAVVNQSGQITGKKKGKATVTATYKGKDYVCEVSVK